MDSPKIATLGELRKTDYKSESIQQELAGNLRHYILLIHTVLFLFINSNTFRLTFT